jgi:peptidoglycan/xylan/chitin deacetylase (PgdA/CDA1 family)
MRIVAAGRSALSGIGGLLLSNLTNQDTAMGLGYELSGLGSILVFHEIHDDADAELHVGCSSRALEKLINIIRQSGTDFVTMDGTLLRIDDKQAKPFATVTFDDGYRNTYERAAPVLERLNGPFTIYVPTYAVTCELYAWWLALRMLFQDVVTIDAMNQRFSCFDLKSKIAALRIVRNWVGEYFRLKDALRQTFKSNDISLEALSDKFLNAEELCELAHRLLVTIGAHTTSHAALSILSLEDMKAEMSDNRDFLENLNKESEVSHFAYPCVGSASSPPPNGLGLNPPQRRQIGRSAMEAASMLCRGSISPADSDWTAPITRSPPLRAFTAPSAERRFL